MEHMQADLFWDITFRDELEAAAVNEGLQLWALGGPCFALRTPQAMLYLDPYLGGDPVEASDIEPGTYRTTRVPVSPRQIRLADGVLISHEHYDHCHKDTLLAMAEATEALFYGPPSVVQQMHSFGLPEGRIREVKVGDQVEMNDARVTVCRSHDAEQPDAVTFLVEADGVKVFFAGDSHSGPAFDEIGETGEVDIAMLAFGRTWYMDEAQLLDAAERLRPKLLLPYHWELWRSHTGDVLELGRLVERLQPSFDVVVLLIGQYLHYRPGGQFATGG